MFQTTTFAQFKAQLAEKLGDPNNIFWTSVELERYIKEALRTWGSMALYWKDTEILPTTSGQAFYDLNTLGIVDQTVTDQDLALMIENHLQEPEATSTWTGTDQFSLTAIQRALSRRLNLFLLEVGIITERSTQTLAAGYGRADLTSNTLDIRRAYWVDSVGSSNPLARGDSREFNSYKWGWSRNQGQPIAYSIVTEPRLTLQLAPANIDNGVLDLISIIEGPTLNLATGVLLTIPDDLAWIIKWGALAELLTEIGIAQEIPRAQYCEARWQEGINIAKLYPSVMSASIGNVQMPISSIQDFDTDRPLWQATTGTPTNLGISSYNLLALYPVPTSSALELEIDVVANAILPSTDGDYIQVSSDYMGVLLDYAHHLAAFKMGGAEFLVTQVAHERLVKAAAHFNSRLAANSNLFTALQGQSLKERVERPIS